MEMINLIFFIWAIMVGILIVFMAGERIATNWPETRFAKVWRNSIAIWW